MTKKLGFLTLMALAIAGFAASMAQGTAGLTWTANGVHIAAGTNPSVHTEPGNTAGSAIGWAKFSNATLGGTECPVTAEVTLTGGTSTAHVTEFTVSNTEHCKLNGSLLMSCVKLTEHLVTGATPGTLQANGKPLVTANGGAWLATGTLSGGVGSLDILNEVVIHNLYEPKAGDPGKLCPKKVTLESTATQKPTITLNSSSAPTQATLGGTLTATNESGHLGSVNITGTLTFTVPERGTYGIT